MDNTKEFTLLDAARREVTLTEDQKNQLFDLLKSGLHEKRRTRLWNKINYGIYPREGMFSRVIFNSDRLTCQYVAGQSYPDEIKLIRDLIIR